MLNFRQKIFFSYLIVFLFFLILLFPYSSTSVRNAIRNVLEDRTQAVIDTISKSNNIQGMIEHLDAQQALVFFRVTLLSEDGRILYESHTDRSALPLYKRHPEIEDALSHKIGYHEDYSYHFGEQFAYIAQSFSFQGKTFILRTAFPIKQIKDLTRNFKLVLIKFGIGILVLFSLMTWIITSLLSKPINLIIEKVKPYKEGLDEYLPQITFEDKRVSHDFVQLASTLNSLSDRIRNQVDTLTEERNQTETVLNSLAEGVIAVDNEMKIIFINEIAIKMFGIDKSILMHQHVSLLKSPKCLSLLKACRKKNKTIYDTLDLNDGEKKIPLGLIVTPKKDQGAILVLQDKSNLFQILDMGKAFIANASHELKTPITVIRGYAEVFKENPELDASMQEDMLDKILSNCHRMEALVKNLLTLTDIENLPQSRLKKCDLVHSIQDCISSIQSLNKDAKVELSNSSNSKIKVMADPDLLNRAIMNLMENAIKYNQKKPTIQVELTLEETKVKITISDNGMGIPTKDLPHIFERFYRVDKARSRQMGGSGLGLSIVKTIVEKLKGTISVDSQSNVGTTFTIILPQAEFFS
ncbi:MAG: Adaptive-response sensory-kinase SasA [Chlamydiae bacterium]|nr:Adaptive-response sensory-kinase SasA [Chlamydiota bacterium]